MKRFFSPKEEVYNYWYAPVDRFHFATADFYKMIENELTDLKVPGLELYPHLPCPSCVPRFIDADARKGENVRHASSLISSLHSAHSTLISPIKPEMSPRQVRTHFGGFASRTLVSGAFGNNVTERDRYVGEQVCGKRA